MGISVRAERAACHARLGTPFDLKESVGVPSVAQTETTDPPPREMPWEALRGSPAQETPNHGSEGTLLRQRRPQGVARRC